MSITVGSSSRGLAIAGILAGIALIGEFIFFGLSGFPGTGFNDPAVALPYLDQGGAMLRIAVLFGAAGVGLWTVFAIGLAARLQRRTPARAVASLYLTLLGGDMVRQRTLPPARRPRHPDGDRHAHGRSGRRGRVSRRAAARGHLPALGWHRAPPSRHRSGRRKRASHGVMAGFPPWHRSGIPRPAFDPQASSGIIEVSGGGRAAGTGAVTQTPALVCGLCVESQRNEFRSD